MLRHVQLLALTLGFGFFANSAFADPPWYFPEGDSNPAGKWHFPSTDELPASCGNLPGEFGDVAHTSEGFQRALKYRSVAAVGHGYDRTAGLIGLRACDAVNPALGDRALFLIMCDPVSNNVAQRCAIHNPGMPVFCPNGTLNIRFTDNGSKYGILDVCVHNRGIPVELDRAFSICRQSPRADLFGADLRDCRNPRALFHPDATVRFTRTPRGYDFGGGCSKSIVRLERLTACKAMGAVGGVLAGNFAAGCLTAMSQKANCNVAGMTAADYIEIGLRMSLNPAVGSTMGCGDPGKDAPTISREKAMQKVRDMGIVGGGYACQTSFCNPRRMQQRDPTIGEVWDSVCTGAKKYFNRTCGDIKSACGY